MMRAIFVTVVASILSLCNVSARSDWKTLQGTSANDKDFKMNYFSEFGETATGEDIENLYATIQMQFTDTWKPIEGNSVRICIAYKQSDDNSGRNWETVAFMQPYWG